jgi:2-polyprenyl-6-methoxyphenol hydroxylase-like FAD-dependent oxidoreductase
LPDAGTGITLLSVQAIRIIAMGRALVIGGSLGGLFAGLLLRQSGWDVAVFERSSGDLASRGVGIGTHVEQFGIMRRLGITVDERIGVALTSRICLDRDGAVIARLPFEKTLTSWALFYRALRRRLPDACYRPGMQLEDVTQDASCVTALFANGIKVEGDLLVGADGTHSTVRSRVFGGPTQSYAGYVAWRGVLDEDTVAAAGCGDLIDTYALFPRELVLSYWQPGADDDFRRRRLNWIWYHPVGSAELEILCTDASGRRHNGGIPPPLIRPEVIAAFRTEVRAVLAPQYIALTEATPAPFFQPIFDLDSPRIVTGRVALLGDAAFVARPHVAAGVTKAALNAAWLTDVLAATPDDIDAALATYAARAKSFGSAMVARARFLGAYLESSPRVGRRLLERRYAISQNWRAPLHSEKTDPRGSRVSAGSMQGLKASTLRPQCPLWVMCGRRLGKNFLTQLQHWSGAVMCPACLCGG